MKTGIPLRSRRWLAAAVAMLAMVVYANSIPNGFALDDESIVEHNERVHGIEHIDEAVTLPYWPNGPASSALYRPLTTASFAVEWDLWNGNPHGFHATNVLLHGAVTLLVLLLISALGAPPLAAALGAAVFAVHPVHTEAVANIVGRAELLAALFYLAGCLLYLRGGRHAMLRAIGIGACYFLALGAKEIAVTLPVALVLLEAGRAGIGRPLVAELRQRVPVGVSLTLAAGMYGLVRFAVLDGHLGVDAAPSLAGGDALGRIATAMSVWPEYARLLVLPLDLVADYSPEVLTAVDGVTWKVVLGFILGAASLTLGWTVRRRRPFFFVGVFWFAIAIFPVSNLVVPVGVLLAERTLYLPSVGIALITAAGAVRLARADLAARRVGTVAAFLVLLLGAGWTWKRNPTWRSTPAVVAGLARDHPESFRVQWVIANNRIRDGRVREGLELYTRLAEMMPNHYSLQLDYGGTLVTYGRPARAEPVLRHAIGLVPQHSSPVVLLSQSLINRDRPRDALSAVANVLDSMPNDHALYHQAATALERLGEWVPALAARRVSIGLAGVRAGWRQWRSLAEIEYRLGEIHDARRVLERARMLAPANRRAELTLDRLARRAAAIP